MLYLRAVLIAVVAAVVALLVVMVALGVVPDWGDYVRATRPPTTTVPVVVPGALDAAMVDCLADVLDDDDGHTQSEAWALCAEDLGVPASLDYWRGR